MVDTLVLGGVERLPRDERRREPGALWLWWHGPEEMTPVLDTIRRFDLDRAFRFLKQTTGWIPPSGAPFRAGRPLELAGGGRLHAALRLARIRVADLRPPRERCYDEGRPTPVRVHGGVSSLLAQVSTPAKAPKPCGKSPGRPKGRLSGRAKRYPAINTAA